MNTQEIAEHNRRITEQEDKKKSEQVRICNFCKSEFIVYDMTKRGNFPIHPRYSVCLKCREGTYYNPSDWRYVGD